MTRRAAHASKRAIVVGIVLVIALLHVFRAGSHLRAPLRDLYYGYFSDVVIPFAVYFLLCLQEHPPILRDRRVKAAIVFAAAAFAETLQGLGVPFLGRTFDPFDYAMFAAGVTLAVAVDRLALTPFVPGWASTTAGSADAVR